jgi:hypothetical protein
MAVGTEAAGGRVLPGLHWSAVIAGVFLAIASHIVLGLVGGALGFSAAPADSTGLGAGAAIWGLVTPFVATLLGAWLAVGMAGAAGDRTGSTLHGIMVWCIGLIAGAIFLTGTIASGAMTAGTAARAGPARIFRGEPGRVSALADQAGKAAAAVMGGAALASIAGLLGAVAGVGIARSRRSGRGLRWRLAIQRREERGAERFGEPRREEREYGAPYGESRPGATAEPRRDVGPPPTDPYHH